jgi:hypothetical protein
MKGVMQNVLLIFVAATLSISAAAADPVVPRKSTTAAIVGKRLAVRQGAPRNACAAYGPGFVKVEGSDTCVKVGGSISVGVGGSR